LWGFLLFVKGWNFDRKEPFSNAFSNQLSNKEFFA